MGAIFTKLCPWFFKNNEEHLLTEDIEMPSRTSEITGDYKMLKTDENLNELEDVTIKISNLVQQRNCNPSEFYEKIKELGSGSFGQVVKVKHKQSGGLRAMKIIEKVAIQQDVNISEVEKEIDILKRLDHPNILKIYEFFKDDQNYYIVTELCEHGDLFDKLEQMRLLNELAVRILMYQILSAVAYLHSRNVIHGDLKLENILIDNVNASHRTSFRSSLNKDLKNLKLLDGLPNIKEKEIFLKNFSNYEIKIIDFGCSKMFAKGKSKAVSGVIGTAMYCAPEVLKDKYNEKCDIWACGVIMYCLLTGYPPFQGETDDDIFREILKGQVNFDLPEFEDVSDSAKDLIKSLLLYDTRNRPSAKQALKHPFLQMDYGSNSSFKETLDISTLTNLTHCQGSKFKQAVIAYIAHNFANQEEVQKLRRLFKYLDKDSDGTITKEELLEGYKNLGEEISEEMIDNIIKDIDNDGNGFIEYEEFIRASHNKTLLLTDENLKMAFDLFDQDQSGTISCEEIKKIIFADKFVPEKLINDFLAQINKVSTDLITFEEFKKVML